MNDYHAMASAHLNHLMTLPGAKLVSDAGGIVIVMPDHVIKGCTLVYGISPSDGRLLREVVDPMGRVTHRMVLNSFESWDVL